MFSCLALCLVVAQNLTQNRVAGGRLIDSDTISVSSVEARNVRRPSSSSAAPGGLPSLGRLLLSSALFFIFSVNFYFGTFLMHISSWLMLGRSLVSRHQVAKIFFLSLCCHFAAYFCLAFYLSRTKVKFLGSHE